LATRTHNELLVELGEQIEFLKRSAESYDNGFDGEAKRLALALRILVHDTKTSHSLLGQLTRLNGKFIGSAILEEPINKFPYSGLASILMVGSESKYVALLDDVFGHAVWLPFKEWWTQVIFDDHQGTNLTRRELILTAVDKDGGAHVDPELDGAYHKLFRGDSLRWQVVKEGVRSPIPLAERAAIRQIAHEMLRTLEPKYRKRAPAILEGVAFSVSIVKKKKNPKELHVIKIGRNESCPCGVGLKYKECHGS
jgi:hypothetical protein